MEKIANLYSISPQQINRIYRQGPTGIHVLVSNEVRGEKGGYIYFRDVTVVWLPEARMNFEIMECVFKGEL